MNNSSPWYSFTDATIPLPTRPAPSAKQTPHPDLLVIGPEPSLARLQEAYLLGAFPCYSANEPPLWWQTDPRMVLQVQNFRAHRSLRQLLKRTYIVCPGDTIPAQGWAVSCDRSFEKIIAACSSTPRRNQKSSGWIVPKIQQSYTEWHHAGQAHSIETWFNGELVGGLYGVSLGHVFFGESMFSLTSNASKIALAALVAWCTCLKIDQIDCQMHSLHLESMGAKLQALDDFMRDVSLHATAWTTEAVWPADLLIQHPWRRYE